MSGHSPALPPHAELALAQLQHGACRFLCFEQLAQGKPEILIEFKGQIYRLRATKNDKLILNK